MMPRVQPAPAPDFPDRTLCRFGGAAALLAAGLTLSEVVLLATYPPPATISGWFDLFRSSPVLGALDFWGLELPMYIAFALTFLALCTVLRKEHRGLMAVALVLAVVGVGVFLATNNPFSMLSLSKQYAAATTDAERSVLLAAGQTVLVNTGQRAIGGFNTGLFLVTGAGLMVSSVMLRSHAFRTSTAYLGLVAHGLSLIDYLRQAFSSSPIVALLVILPNAFCLVAWYYIVGRRLYRLGH